MTGDLDRASTTPVVVYDGDCGICTRLARLVTRRVRPHPGAFTVVAYQDAELGALALTARQCADALQWVEPDGHVRSAQHAVAAVLRHGRWWQRPVGGLLVLPGISALAGMGYRWVARNRSRLPGGTPACSLPPEARPR